MGYDELTYAQIQGSLGEASASELPALRLVVLRNITVEPIEPCLAFLARDMGFRAEVAFGGYDAILQDAAADDRGLLSRAIDCALVFMFLESASPRLVREFPSLSPAKIEDEIARIVAMVQSTLTGIRRHSGALVLWHGFETPIAPAFGIADAQRNDGQRDTIEALNRRVRDAVAQNRGARWIDLGACLARIGMDNAYDRRLWHYGRAPYSRAALKSIAREDFKAIRALKGRDKKCVVVDCDNVLWGGIVGEDGIEGIRLGFESPGSEYREFQQELRNLRQRGVLLVLCSKNNEADVWEAFDRHPGMALRRDDIVAARVNWQDKAANLRSIAAELNIGLDSIVFIDDSPFEAELVRRELPDVDVLCLDPGRPHEFSSRLLAYGLFDTLHVTDEDRQRTALYRGESRRRASQDAATDIAGHLKSLDMAAEVRFSDADTVSRIAQLAQKTNQFNLTTRRHSEAEIKKFVERQDADVLYLKLTDRFGSLGIVGVCILVYEGGAATIDTFLFSCRALGRHAEDVLLNEAVRRARQRGCSRMIGIHRPTAKNAQTRTFYAERGFASMGESASEAAFALDLDTAAIMVPPVFAAVASDVTASPTRRKA